MPMFYKIPTERPLTPLLDTVNDPAHLRQFDIIQLTQLARELREYMLYSTGQTGGHFGAGLGVVELTIALHYTLNTPSDRLVWDVGHQAYPHKILTGRREKILTMRQNHGLSPFPKRCESPYDTFGVGHSSTSISAGLGMSVASSLTNKERKVVAVIGDGAMTAGMAFEAMNHASHQQSNLLVVLNDNNMSISPNVGGLSNYFARIWSSKLYTSVRESGKKVLSTLPAPALELARRTEEHMKGMVSPATLFEELGFNYIGPIDGHDLESLISTLQNMTELRGPQLLHVITKKGKGFAPAEADPIQYHAIGKTAANKSDKPKKSPPKYQDVFGQWICDMAEIDSRLIGITPAMREGSGLVTFSQRFPDRYHDVAIAEQHAVTFAAGLACEQMKPVVAIYSTFLQRAYDQLIHDVAIQNLDILFAIDRAGLVGEDGATHAGSFDLSYLRCIPNMVIATPSDENECRLLLSTAYHYPGPAAVRYPRGQAVGVDINPSLDVLPIGKGVVRKRGKNIALLVFGTSLASSLAAARKLNATVADMRFVKPLDEALLTELAEQHDLLVTIEENTIAGGAGSAVLEFLARSGQIKPFLQLGLPDRFLEHGTHNHQLTSCGLDEEGIYTATQARWQQLLNKTAESVVL
jgi:1-deoxy-D-xylulose-5-phosphate synthase